MNKEFMICPENAGVTEVHLANGTLSCRRVGSVEGLAVDSSQAVFV